MIVHCVFCQFRPDTSGAERLALLTKLAEFSATLEGVISFDLGPNRDFEQKSQGFSGGFVIRFVDQAALEVYAEHPTHKALGAALCALCVGGGDGIMVFDLETPQ